MLRALKTPGVLRAAQIVVGILFGWAALAKLADLSAFALQVHNFRLLPLSAENLVAMLLPWVELCALACAGIRPARVMGGPAHRGVHAGVARPALAWTSMRVLRRPARHGGWETRPESGHAPLAWIAPGGGPRTPRGPSPPLGRGR